MAAGDELPAELLIIVDLAVEDDDLGPVFVEDRLSATAQIDNAETSHAEADATVYEQPLVVGPPVADGRTHAAECLGGNGTIPFAVHDTDDAAHE